MYWIKKTCSCYCNAAESGDAVEDTWNAAARTGFQWSTPYTPVYSPTKEMTAVNSREG